MVVYEVNLRIAPEIEADYRRWLAGHIAEIVALPGFVSATQYTDLAPSPDGWAGVVVHYTLDGQDALDHYLDRDAPRLRADGIARFGDRFVATRRVLALDTVHPVAGWSKAV